MRYDLDASYENFLDWMHEYYSSPEEIQCDNCDEVFLEEDADWVEFHGFNFCCEACFNQCLINSPTLREAWNNYQECEDDF